MAQESQRSPYYDVYKGKTLLLEVNGMHAEGEKFETLARTIHRFVKEGIRVMMADDAVSAVAAHCAGSIDEVMMVTETGGVLDKKGKIAPLLSTATIDEIVAGRHPDIEAKDGMLQKLREVREMLQHVAKVSITDDPQKEIENWRGRGTLCINEGKLTFEPANEQDTAIFRQAHADLAKEGKFRPRTEAELSEAALHHFCLKIEDAPLAGLSLVPRGGEWLELACLWSSYTRNGIASRIMREALEEAKGHKIYALTSEENAQRLFERMQFVAHGRLKQLQQRPSFSLPKALSNYDTDKRNPFVFSRGLRKSIPRKQAARRISMLLEEAHAAEDGHAVFHGSRPNPQAGAQAKYALARSGRRVDEWKPVALRYGLPYSIDL